jgi:hypothetical protein
MTEADFLSTNAKLRELRARGWTNDLLEGVVKLANQTWLMAGRDGKPSMELILTNLLSGEWDDLMFDEDSHQGKN